MQQLIYISSRDSLPGAGVGVGAVTVVGTMHSGTVRSGPVSVRKMKTVAVLVTVAVGQTAAIVH